MSELIIMSDSSSPPSALLQDDELIFVPSELENPASSLMEEGLGSPVTTCAASGQNDENHCQVNVMPNTTQATVSEQDDH